MAKQQTKKKHTFLKVYLTAIITLCVGVVGVGYWYKNIHNQKPKPPSLAMLKSWQLGLPQITTNTADGGLVQMTLTIQAGNGKSFKDMQAAQNQIMDTINQTVIASPSNDFVNANELTQFKQSVLNKIQSIVPGDKVDGVDITQIVEQG